jgi:hypothetical protein
MRRAACCGLIRLKETLIYLVIARRAVAFSRERSAAGRGNPECLSNQKRWIAALRSQ